MSKKNGEEGQEFFIRLSNPNTFRRYLLEASKMTLTILKQTYKVKQIREAKHELMSRIAREVKELKILVQKTDEMMPRYNQAEIRKILPDLIIIREQPEAKPQKAEAQLEAKPEAKAELKPKQPKPPVSEIDKVSRALADIQRKLSSL
jgi:hypothetical protein